MLRRISNVLSGKFQNIINDVSKHVEINLIALHKKLENQGLKAIEENASESTGFLTPDATPITLKNGEHLRLMEDCRVGSDTDYAPYGLDSEWQWVIRAKGNVFSCPVPPCVANGVCNASVADPVASPIRCQ